MTNRHLHTDFTARRPGPAPRAVFAFGFWLRAGFVALSVAAIALMMLADGEASASATLVTFFAGLGVAAFAWRKAWILIGRLESIEPAGAETDPAPPQPAPFAAQVESSASR